jgi:predicted ribosome quality control (RQC) complex YloA/Tae2 family protein
MSERQLISVLELCRSYELDIAIMIEFADAGLYTPLIEEQEWFLDSEELPELESLIRLFQSFEISPEGLDVIRHLRRQVKDLRAQLRKQEQLLEALKKRDLQFGQETEDI